MNTELVINEFSNKQFVQDTLLQIQKDFSRCGWEIDSLRLNQRLTKVELEELIGEKLVEIMKHGESQLLQLIYIIDIPEKEFLSSVTQKEVVKILSEKILLKEAYKVYLRRKFS
jgi:hypothetical protein